MCLEKHFDNFIIYVLTYYHKDWLMDQFSFEVSIYNQRYSVFETKEEI